MASTAEKFSRSSARTHIDRTYVRTRTIRRRRSSGERPEPIQATRTMGSATHRDAVAANALEVQPPHFRYQPKANSMQETQAEKSVSASQSMRKGRGVAGR